MTEDELSRAVSTYYSKMLSLFSVSFLHTSMSVSFLLQLAPMSTLPNQAHRRAIENALAVTMRNRREWIEKEEPTITDVLQKYKHLISYEGEMVRFCYFRDICCYFDSVQIFLKQLGLVAD